MSLKQLSFLLDGIHVAGTRKMGRGVYTKQPIPMGEIIEVAPVIVMDAKDRLHLDQTLLHDYIFEWGEDHRQCCMALGFIPIYNHSYQSNCEYEMFFSKQVIMVKAVRRIEAGEELFINYNGDWNNEKKVWFDTV